MQKWGFCPSWPLPGHFCSQFPRRSDPESRATSRGDQPLPRAGLLFPGELLALPQPSQGITRGNLSPSPALTALAPCSGLFPLWNHSELCCNACPHPSGAQEVLRAVPCSCWLCLSVLGTVFGCHGDGAEPSITPSTNWLPCFTGQGISELKRLMALPLQQEKLSGPGLRVDPCQGPGTAELRPCQACPGDEGLQTECPWRGSGQPSHQPPLPRWDHAVPSPPSFPALGNVPGERPAVKSCSSWNVGGRARLLESQRSSTYLLPPRELTPRI